MKKILKTDDIANELEGASLFFARPTTPPLSQAIQAEKVPGWVEAAPISSQPIAEQEKPQETAEPRPPKKIQTKQRDTMTPRYHDTTVSRYHDTKQSSMQASIHGVTVEIVRKAVKEFGKEAATHRFTDSEKKEIADLIYTYKNTGIRTSENEVTRIAVNFIIQDYRENGEQSVLHKILAALNG